MNKKGNVLAIAIMFFLFAMISFVTGLQNPMGIIVKAQFGATNAMSQLGNLANFIAYAFMGLPAGFILKKYGYKVTSMAAVAVGFIGVGISWLSGVAESFGVYLTGAFVSGFSMCMLNTVVNPMLNTLGGGGNKGNQLIQFGGSLNSLAATIVPVLVGYLIGDAASARISDANPALFIAMGIFAVAFIIIAFSQIPEPELEAAKAAAAAGKEEEGTMASIKGALSHKNLVFGVIAIFLYVGIEVGIPNIANLYMTSSEVGISAAVAGTVVGMYWLLMLCGRLLGGFIGGKVSSKAMMTAVSSIAILFLLIGMFLPDTKVMFPAINADLSFSLVQIPLGVVFFVLCGLCTSVMWGAIFNLAVEGLGKYTSIASGLFMVMVCGGGVLPVIQGAVADAFNYIDSYWVLIVALAYILWFALFGSKVSKAE
ncbi:MAG: MFS transporter [Bacteroidetes bacterium]|uniref:MFS transporter n=1 Tax=Candidatus Cryptobacteroides faecigallinarum TaxID=2840763 RepID=A0A9D9NHD8_9BACT|nr:MFS transporter [Candidatus Cryptobacteroides faecigallinarum]